MKQFHFNKRNLPKIIEWVTIFSLGIALILWEYVNYITTYDSNVAMYGPHLWITIMSLAIVFTDFFALARVFTPTTNNAQEPKIVKTLLSIWFAVTICDAFYSWYFAAMQMEATQVRSPGAMTEFLWIMPILVAVVMWGVQFGLLYLFGLLLDTALHSQPQYKPQYAPPPAYTKPSMPPVSNNHKQPVPGGPSSSWETLIVPPK